MQSNLDKKEDLYRSTNFATICSLYYLGFELDGFERDLQFPGKVAVYFTRTEALNNALQSLRGRQLSVEPVAFLETTREVRGRLRDCA